MHNLISKSDPQFENDAAAKKQGKHFAQEEIVKILPNGRAKFIVV